MINMLRALMRKGATCKNRCGNKQGEKKAKTVTIMCFMGSSADWTQPRRDH